MKRFLPLCLSWPLFGLTLFAPCLFLSPWALLLAAARARTHAVFALPGRVPRALLHRLLFTLNPWLKYFGVVAGYRDTAEELLRAGIVAHFCIVPLVWRCSVLPSL